MHGSEFEIIERYFGGSISNEGKQVRLGPGDDCAILQVPAGRHLCLSIDTLVAGVHFPADACGAVVAHRSLAANLSDLAAMGADCFAFVLALTLPAENHKWLEEFSARLSDMVSHYEMPLVGGNLARGELSVTITVLGTLPEGKALKRSGARVGDDVYVTGTLGDAAAGLALLARGDDSEAHLVERYRYPTPRLEVGQALLDIASAAIDISDGLAADLGHICDRSEVGAEIAVDQVPLSLPLTKWFDRQAAEQFAMSAGDDYELCFTAAPAQRDAIAAIAARLETPISRIGRIVEGGDVVFFDADGVPRNLAEHGYQHFHEP